MGRKDEILSLIEQNRYFKYSRNFWKTKTFSTIMKKVIFFKLENL